MPFKPGGPPRRAALAAALTIACLMGWGRPGPVLRAAPPPADQALEYQVKAVFLYHFTRYMQWPEGGDDRAFEIAVLGESPILGPLREIERKRSVGPLPIVVHPCATVGEVGSPRILFVAGAAARRLPEVLERTRGRGVLTVTEGEGMAVKGAAVNFVLREGAVKFEINERALREAGILAGSQLMKLAIRVGGEPPERGR